MVRGVPGDMVKGQGSGPQRGTYLVGSNSGYITIYLDVSGFQPRGCPYGVHWLKSAQSLAGESGSAFLSSPVPEEVRKQACNPS